MTPDSTFLDAFRRAADTAGHHRGFRFYSSPSEWAFHSYATLDRQARADAAALAEAGHRPGEVVVLAFDSGLPFIRSLAALFYAGLIAAPVPVGAVRHPVVARRRLEGVIADSGSRLVLTDGAALSPLDIDDGVVAQASVVQVSELDGEPDDWAPPVIDGDSLALLQYTSGSTGEPKGVMVSHGNLVANGRAITDAARITPESRTMGWLPHYHDMGLVGQLLQPISVGADSVLTSPSQFLRRPVLWLRLLTEHRSTHTVGPDFAYGLCTRLVTDEQLDTVDLSSLEGVITGAEPVRIATLEAFANRFARAGFRAGAFIPAFGIAEATLLVTAKVGDRAVTAVRADAGALEQGVLRTAASGDRVVELVSCGPPVDGHRIAIVDPTTTARVPDRGIGEILVHGPSVAQGYWRRRAETEAVFEATIPGDGDGLRYLRTGDLGSLVDGELVITGRLKDLIIIRGRNLYPQDLEASAESILQSGCLSAAFEGRDAQPVVGIVAEVDIARLTGGGADELAQRVRSIVTQEFLIPELGVALIRKGTLPRTTSGKVQRALTRSLLEQDRLATLASVGFDLGGTR